MSRSGWDFISFYCPWKAGMLSKEKSGCQLVLAWASIFCLNLKAVMPAQGWVIWQLFLLWRGRSRSSQAELFCLSCHQEGEGWRWVVGWSCGYRWQWGWVTESAGHPERRILLPLATPRCPALEGKQVPNPVQQFLFFNLSSSWFAFQSFWGTELVYRTARPVPELAQGKRWERLEQRWERSPFGSSKLLIWFLIEPLLS